VRTLATESTALASRSRQISWGTPLAAAGFHLGFFSRKRCHVASLYARASGPNPSFKGSRRCEATALENHKRFNSFPVLDQFIVRYRVHLPFAETGLV
jgi:hypothetical protein